MNLAPVGVTGATRTRGCVSGVIVDWWSRTGRVLVLLVHAVSLG